MRRSAPRAVVEPSGDRPSLMNRCRNRSSSPSGWPHDLERHCSPVRLYRPDDVPIDPAPNSGTARVIRPMMAWVTTRYGTGLAAIIKPADRPCKAYLLLIRSLVRDDPSWHGANPGWVVGPFGLRLACRPLGERARDRLRALSRLRAVASARAATSRGIRPERLTLRLRAHYFVALLRAAAAGRRDRGQPAHCTMWSDVDRFSTRAARAPSGRRYTSVLEWLGAASTNPRARWCFGPPRIPIWRREGVASAPSRRVAGLGLYVAPPVLPGLGRSARPAAQRPRPGRPLVARRSATLCDYAPYSSARSRRRFRQERAAVRSTPGDPRTGIPTRRPAAQVHDVLTE